MGTILIITHRRGFEADPVIDELRRRNIDVFRFNCDSGENVSSISFTSETDEVAFECDDRRITSKDISLGWCQQLPPYLGQPANERECLERENLLAIQNGAFELMPIPWFNEPRHVLCASNKINQLVMAKRVGLTIPETLVSNNPRAIREFAKGRTIVAKNLATPWIVKCGKTRAAYTKIVDPSWIVDDDVLSFSPVIYQEYCERRKDFRVVMVKEDVFAAMCIPGPDQREDVRKEAGTGESFVACEFDKSALQKLHLLMHILSLDYCAADFMESQNGDLFFLEVNTCGAWWWLDRLYNGGICRTIADSLQT